MADKTARPETEMVRRALAPGALAILLAATLGFVFGGTDAAASASIGCAVVLANFAAHGASLAWASLISVTAVQAVALGGVVVRLGVIVAVMFALETTSWFSPLAFGLAAVPATILLLSYETRLVMRGVGAGLQIPADPTAVRAAERLAAREAEVLSGVLASSTPPAGFEAPGTEIFKTACVLGKGWALDLFGFHVNACINRAVLYMFLSAVVVIALFLVPVAKPGFVPRGLQNLVESMVEFVRNQIVLEVIGPEGLAWVPFLTTMLVFIFVNNILGIIPGVQFPATSRMAIPAFLAILVWFLFNIAGIRAQGLRYFKNTLFPPGVPVALYILATPIELVTVFLVRPLTLSVRLLANMIAGHMILTIFFLGTAYLLAKPATIPFAIPAFALSVLLVGFEILVAVLQAYIFTILTAVYIAGAIHPEH